MPTLLENASKLNNEDLQGIVRLQSFAKLPKKNSKTEFFGSGSVVIKGGELLSFKVWDEFLISKFETIIKDLGLGCFLGLNCKGNVYNGSFGVVVEKVTVLDQDTFSIADFYPLKHDVNELMSRVNKVLASRVSEKGRRLVGEILTGNLAKRFTEEFAGMTHHDAEPLGLLHHTTKLLEVLDVIMKQHDNFYQDQDNIDLIYVGVLLHDIGKTLELKGGTYTNISVATHRFLGAELIFQHKQTITDYLYNEMWYYNLISIITQHHGQYEERPRTIFAYIAHLVDIFDTKLTMLEESLGRTENNQSVRLDDFMLRVEKEQSASVSK